MLINVVKFHIWRISDYGVEAGGFGFEDMREFGVPIEWVDFVSQFIEIPAFAGMTGGVYGIEEVWGDERVAALDVGGEVGQCSFVK